MTEVGRPKRFSPVGSTFAVMMQANLIALYYRSGPGKAEVGKVGQKAVIGS